MRLRFIAYLWVIISLGMSYVCTGCDIAYFSSVGLSRHEAQCSFKIEQEQVPSNALEIYEKKQSRKRRKLREQKRAAEDLNRLLPDLLEVRRPLFKYEFINHPSSYSPLPLSILISSWKLTKIPICPPI